MDPAGNRIVIRDKKHEHDFPMQPGVLDQNSVTLAIAQDLANGKRGTLSYPVATKSNVEVQRYQVGKEETLRLPAGAVRTVVVTRLRDTPNGRVTAYWFGLDNGYVPARIVQNELQWRLVGSQPASLIALEGHYVRRGAISNIIGSWQLASGRMPGPIAALFARPHQRSRAIMPDSWRRGPPSFSSMFS